MSFPIAPRPSLSGGDQGPPSPALAKSRKISTACGACKQRKTRCTGGEPCDACATRNSECIYDAAADQRRKIANQRNVQELALAEMDLSRKQALLGGIISIIRAGGSRSTNDLVDFIRSGIDLSSLAAYVRNEVYTNMAVEQAYRDIDFTITIEGGSDLPSPSQLLSRLDSAQSTQSQNQSHSLPGSESTSGSTSVHAPDPSISR
ncbi:uncharacterized protein HMPREF1541_05569 [Cyphellophora europaea CBS 101466]|uniref:Zn(2)-C6 fungal-type domain-containing protein n=1 Tax=Cyphellophora europaea (strain CBS 101466) TaxID=1220924 RepID=W2RS57_CYPE1|nr:uncharacterized protein HMPREF1541_05569 [Cyphellophora europaea CBS 101466]ETN39346.1 hypothetical protein HMPREF1541_05569 [Cyphellophora europaea CBS 101466]